MIRLTHNLEHHDYEKSKMCSGTFNVIGEAGIILWRETLLMREDVGNSLAI